uniref:Uncharacterized protein n=1 Tax=Setaria viridis TaxID=4556 RepID=A0A4U6VF19_SETVI|nr:hypothetical protein SEVIR_3G242733v2 [Setaria viridis]
MKIVTRMMSLWATVMIVMKTVFPSQIKWNDNENKISQRGKAL